MRLWLFILSSILFAQQAPRPAGGTGAAPSKPNYQERRAELLRAVGDLRARIQALELELQLLDEERQSQPEPSTPAAGAAPAAWRESTVRPDGRKDEQVVKKTAPRCSAFTANGKRCTRSAEGGSKFCWQHRH